MYSSFTFPTPHLLSRSSPSVYPSSLNPPGSIVSDGSSHTPKHSFPISRICADGHDETDYAPPSAKRVKRTKAIPAERHLLDTEQSLTREVVRCFEDRSLKNFSLFLPSRLPASIVKDRVAFSNFVLSTTANYLSLWKLDKHMRELDIRLPQEYSHHLSDDLEFPSRFLKCAVDNFSPLESIDHLYLPTLNITVHTNLEGILKPLATVQCSIKQCTLPLAFNIQASSLAGLDFSNAAKVLEASTLKEILLISSSDQLALFHYLFHDALTKKGKPSVKLTFTKHNQETSWTGPAYLTELATPEAIGVEVDPHALLESLNKSSNGEVSSTGHLKNGGNKRRHQSMQKRVSLLLL